MEIEPITVDFPLRGEWVAGNTPAERIPSHGTDALGQRYAYDFVRIEKELKGFKFFRASLPRYFLFGVQLDNCYGWSEPIHAPFAGVVIAAKDGWPERARVHLLRDLAIAIKNGFLFNPKKVNDLRSLTGNYIILKMPGKEIYAFFAHRDGVWSKVAAGVPGKREFVRYAA